VAVALIAADTSEEGGLMVTLRGGMTVTEEADDTLMMNDAISLLAAAADAEEALLAACWAAASRCFSSTPRTIAALTILGPDAPVEFAALTNGASSTEITRGGAKGAFASSAAVAKLGTAGSEGPEDAALAGCCSEKGSGNAAGLMEFLISRSLACSMSSGMG